uniref:Ig-like domain-containing protein n=1 Tax=Apteryx owenii TaxID=8824 RepID=A0A8B9QGG9_APTOW
MRPSALLPALCALCALAGEGGREGPGGRGGPGGAGRPGDRAAQATAVAAPRVPHGGSIRLTCRTTCPDPAAKGNLETSIRKHNFQSSPGETSVELINVTEWHSRAGRVPGMPSPSGCSPAGALEQPVLEPVPWMEEGESRNVTCWVPAVAPVRNLSVTLGWGAETLHTETFEHDARLGPHRVLVTHGITARRWHHGRNVTCQAELSLEPHGPHLSSDAVPAALAFPADPELDPEIHLEVNETANVTCAIHTFFPEAHFTLSLDEQPLPASVSEDGRRAVAELSLPQPGAFRLLCAGRVGPKERRAQATVHVYSECPERPHRVLPLPRGGNGNGNGWGEHGMLSFCIAASRASTLGPGRLGPWRGRGARGGGGAGFAPGALTFPPFSPADGPRMDEAGCPRRQNWTEGQEVTLRCSARGNPPPRVQCAQHGQPFPVAEPQTAARAHAGTYLCRAANRLGETERVVEVLVDCECNGIVAVLVAALLAGIIYGIYYRKKKIQQYELRKKQRQLEMQQLEMQPLSGHSPEVAARNGLAPAAGP